MSDNQLVWHFQSDIQIADKYLTESWDIQTKFQIVKPVLRFTDIIRRVPRDRTAQFSAKGAMKSVAKN